jgi:hypothetical protein
VASAQYRSGHFLVDGQDADIVPLLEVYLKGVLGPVLEGSLKKHEYLAMKPEEGLKVPQTD